MAWAGSTRRARLPRDWPARVAKVKARAKGRCQAREHEPECDGIGTDCDHIKSGDDHRLSNLQWLSGPCHDAKTKRDNAARLALRWRPAEPHPGALGGYSDSSPKGPGE